MQEIVGGDVVGKFAGQVLVNQTTDLVAKLGAPAGDINVLQAVYEMQAGDKSLRGLVQGGYDISTNAARLDGRVLGGQLTRENMWSWMHPHSDIQAVKYTALEHDDFSPPKTRQ